MVRVWVVAVVALTAVVGAGSARTGTVSLAVSSVDAQSNSGTISWHARTPVRVVVEYGTTDEYGIWTTPTLPARSGRIVLRGLEPHTQYQFRLVAADASAAPSQVAGSFTTRRIGPFSAATTTGGALVVGGQPLFPRMLLHTCSWYYNSAIAGGINVFMGSGCTRGAKQLQLLDGRAFSLLPIGERGVKGRGLIGWYQPDEADGHGLTSLPAMPPSKRSRRVTFLTLTDHFSARSAPLPIGTAVYPKLISSAEMVGFDTYPLQTRCVRDFTLAFDIQRELVALANGKPTYQWIEAGPMGKCGRSFDPTPATITAEAWLAIAGGARGLGYFPDFWPPDVATAITAVNREITALAPALLAPETPVSYGPDGTTVKAGARALNGAVYVIAVNAANAPATATFTVPGIVGTAVSVFGEGRTLPLSDGRFSDSFGPLGVHVYIAAPPATSQ